MSERLDRLEELFAKKIRDVHENMGVVATRVTECEQRCLKRALETAAESSTEINQNANKFAQLQDWVRTELEGARDLMLRQLS